MSPRWGRLGVDDDRWIVDPTTVRYSGVQFLSRLTARWAVLLDQLGLAWQHQPGPYVLDGLDGADPVPYSPAFVLPGPGLWVHVAGVLAADDLHTLTMAAAAGGLPAVQAGSDGPARVLLVGQLPRIAAPRPRHWLLTRDIDGSVRVHAYDFDTGQVRPVDWLAAAWSPDGRPTLWHPDRGWADLHAAAVEMSRQPYAAEQASAQLTRACAAARKVVLPSE